MAVTIKDVAKLSGVSISTVSRVINDSKPVSPEVKRKVLEVIEEIGYKPNEIARTLVTKKSYLIGVIVTDLADSYVADMVRGIEEVGKMYNYDILLCSTYGDKEAELKYIQLLNRKQVEGMILISDTINDEIDEKISEYSIPFVYLSRYSKFDKYPTVSIDYHFAAYEITKYLIKLGHKNIGFVGYLEDENSTQIEKYEGYSKAMEEMELDPSFIFETQGISIGHGYEALDQSIIKNELTALFCSNDEIAIGALNYCYDNQINTPEDISVVGFGDISIASLIRPKLTTVKEPFYDIGAVAIRRVIKELRKEDVGEKHIKLPYQIQQRNSCIKI
ncbi:LacI family DNA-binding transcriptional regulator [Clostridium sp. D2Q-11]|uniref:LacI family DNA-binding transcriptional regulator n=1 Tax=Anaeromonas frigoriresistens TaxID=2683708 RepID=A0A942UQ97_9FIRM|nr:LacI family DNA-binding transcriptional regulator [Anaeromonas frigoriresistens]MBS4537213.1 LacI family DNA-binding transcriptional regulator [Anaeromonas frigoriresistens]